MAVSRSSSRKLTDQEILRVARARVNESAAATFTQTEIDTQLSIERGAIWLIEWIEWSFEQGQILTEVGASGNESLNMQLTKTSQTAIVNRNDPDLIGTFGIIAGRSAAIGTDAGPLYYLTDAVRMTRFRTPFPVASQSVYFGIQGSDASSTHTCVIRIGYCLKMVTDEYFFRVAQALVG